MLCANRFCILNEDMNPRASTEAQSEGVKMRKSAVLAAIMILSFLIGSVMAESIEDKLTYQGNKARISVGRIKTKASRCPSGEKAG